MRAEYELLLTSLTATSQEHYGERLVSLALFGSVGRGTPRHDSDIDVLIVAENLPDGRIARVAEFRHIETALASELRAMRKVGLTPELSPVIKTPAEIGQGSLLLLDMIDDARLLVDREDFLKRSLAAFQTRLDRLGAKRIWRGNAWIWDLKPDYKVGEVFEL